MAESGEVGREGSQEEAGHAAECLPLCAAMEVLPTAVRVLCAVFRAAYNIILYNIYSSLASGVIGPRGKFTKYNYRCTINSSTV